ncbi:ATP-binding protein [Massilia sp. R2A-15]|uniref:ATP-binding protein n=1 Tax=Massilia sp. R2A-15 TaxID=3064278 RepID=UPI002734CD5C|nr:ATP-binding protein [Massilia sp. R2A-15]WLI90696.1 ATP-binding protein [Massilia sp. R2A-15]
MDLNSLEVNYHAMLVQSPDPSVLLDLDSGRLADANARAEALLGVPRAGLLQMTLAQLCAPIQPDGQAPASLLDHHIARALQGHSEMFPLTLKHAGGAPVPCEALLIRLPVEHQRLAHARLVDISRRVLAEQFREGQREVLELIARDAPLKEVFDRLVHLIEAQSPGVLCSVLLLDTDGVTVRPASGPSLPAPYLESLDGLRIGPDAGSCGDAMFENKTVIVPDIQADPRWANYLKLAEPYGLRACWSRPIAPDGVHVLGSFAMYYREVRAPAEAELHLAEIATHLAGIAIQRNRRLEELTLHRGHLEELVAARTAELTAALARTDQVNRELKNALDTLSLAQGELVRRDKMAALGALVAGVAHELNTPIGNSLVVATSLAEKTGVLADTVTTGLRRSELDRYLADAAEAGALLVRNLKRAATLVAGFKQIAIDHSRLERRAFSLTQLLSDLAAPLRVAAKGAGARIDLALEPGLQMDSYPGPLSQVVTEMFENCLAHAFAGGRGGTVRISAAMRTDELVAVSVEDDGAGMAPDVQARVFDPFFTTTMGAGRSGLGLHVAHNIVTGILGGRIDLRSAPGKGACFTLLLPLAAPQSAGAGA